jgi:hypothetical protein
MASNRTGCELTSEKAVTGEYRRNKSAAIKEQKMSIRRRLLRIKKGFVRKKMGD